MRERELTLDSYEQVIEINKTGIWKQHPLKTKWQDNKITSIPLRMQTTK